MTDDADGSALVRSESCQAETFGRDFLICERCGVAADLRVGKPPCGVMTFRRMLARLDKEIDDLEIGAGAMINIAARGMPAKPLEPLQRAAELRAVRRLVLLNNDSPEIKKLLKALTAKTGDKNG